MLRRLFQGFQIFCGNGLRILHGFRIAGKECVRLFQHLVPDFQFQRLVVDAVRIRQDMQPQHVLFQRPVTLRRSRQRRTADSTDHTQQQCPFQFFHIAHLDESMHRNGEGYTCGGIFYNTSIVFDTRNPFGVNATRSPVRRRNPSLQ